MQLIQDEKDQLQQEVDTLRAEVSQTECPAVAVSTQRADLDR